MANKMIMANNKNNTGDNNEDVLYSKTASRLLEKNGLCVSVSQLKAVAKVLELPPHRIAQAGLRPGRGKKQGDSSSEEDDGFVKTTQDGENEASTAPDRDIHGGELIKAALVAKGLETDLSAGDLRKLLRLLHVFPARLVKLGIVQRSELDSIREDFAAGGSPRGIPLHLRGMRGMHSRGPHGSHPHSIGLHGRPHGHSQPHGHPQPHGPPHPRGPHAHHGAGMEGGGHAHFHPHGPVHGVEGAHHPHRHGHSHGPHSHGPHGHPHAHPHCGPRGFGSRGPHGAHAQPHPHPHPHGPHSDHGGHFGARGGCVGGRGACMA